jgi:hypothetical protein
MQSIDTRGLDELDRALAKAIREAPRKRRELHENLADIAKAEVDKGIAGSINDSHGKIQRWQQKFVGTGGGYAAVRAIGGISGANSPGAITNYLTSGHRIRRPSGAAKRQRRSRARMAYVDGRHFYETAAKTVVAPAIQMAEGFVADLKKTLEG